MLALSARECKPRGGPRHRGNQTARPSVDTCGEGDADRSVAVRTICSYRVRHSTSGGTMSIRRVRGLAVAVLAGCVVAAAPTAAVGAATRASAPVLHASPHANLKDGQSVTVTGTGYPANAETDLVECEEGAGCDFSNLQVQITDADGSYTTDFVVFRILQLDSGPVDCVTNQDCILVSLDISDLSTGAQTSITFDPNAPVKPPLHFRVIPDQNGHVQVAKGVARLTGSVACNQPVDIGADMVLTQVYGRSIFQSEAFVDIPCDHGGHWSAVFRPFNGLFDAGAAKVQISAFGFTTRQYSQFKHTRVTLVARAS
jgi:Neocarzinostatin family